MGPYASATYPGIAVPSPGGLGLAGLTSLGPIGSRALPDDIRRRLDLADALTNEGLATTPIASPWQGAARLADVLAGNSERNQAFADRQSAVDGVNQTFARLFGAGSGAAGPTAAPTAPSTLGSAPSSGSASSDGMVPSDGMASSASGAIHPMAAALLADPNGSGNAGHGAFVQAYLPMAQQAATATGLDPRLILGQAAQETGWGQHAPGNNMFGLKGTSPQGSGQILPTQEVVGGQTVPTQARFQTFAQPADSFAGYANFINANPRYQAMQQAQGLDAQLTALGQSGYASDPAYAAHVGAIARSLPVPAQNANAGPGLTNATLAPSSSVVGTLPSPAGAATAPVGGMSPGRPAIDPSALLGVMTNPWASPQQQQIAATLYGQQSERNRFAQYRDADGSLFQRDLLNNEDKLVQDNHAKSPDIEGYRYARATGFPGSFTDYILSVKKAQAPLVQMTNQLPPATGR